jgi:TldD protein
MPNSHAGLKEQARLAAEASGWVSYSRSAGLVIQLSGQTLEVQQLPPSAGTVVRELADGVQREWGLPGWEDAWAPLGAPVEEFDWRGHRPAAEVPLAEKIEQVRGLEQRLSARDPRIVQVNVLYYETTDHRRVVTETFDRRSQVGRVQFAAQLVVSDRGRTDYDFVGHGRVGGFEIAEITDEECDQLVEGAVRLLDAVPVEPGVYKVVTHPEVSGVLAHEAFGHGVEMDLFLSGRARAERYLGQPVGSQLATIIDDPGRQDGFGGYPFDDDGVLSRPHVILERGILQEGLSDADVRAAGQADGGNGRRQNYTRKVYPRMSNTYFEPGTSTPDALIAGVERGVYLRHVESGMEDPRN